MCGPTSQRSYTQDFGCEASVADLNSTTRDMDTEKFYIHFSLSQIDIGYGV